MGSVREAERSPFRMADDSFERHAAHEARARSEAHRIPE
jgi:hypothetical protein